MGTADQAAYMPAANVESHICIICAREGHHTIFAGDQYRIEECRACGHAETVPAAYVYQSSYAESSQFATNYDVREDEFRGFALRLLRPLQRWQSGGRLLDVGCSVGILVGEASKYGYQAQGIDLDPAAIKVGCHRGRDLACSTMQAWPAYDYDAICASHTLEHIAEPSAFLQEIRAHLKDGGYAAIVVPCHRGLHPRIFRKRWYGWMAHQHYSHYSQQSLRTLLAQTGFEVVESWQESMDYRFKLHGGGSVLHRALGWTEFAVASVGGLLGLGDQVVAIARKR